MLAVKREEITPGNEEYQDVAANLLFEVAGEKEIDPRLQTVRRGGILLLCCFGTVTTDIISDV
ncbi:MAG: hypothetical protein E6230_23615 [Paenibacillus dendritiformis]|uniref:hypothetical protein n=1 Tax=Paenibacillus dendritiformis TaxID=130049 RepID=UPI00143CE1D8|nr:hypothetical protein [Paenibacillus dendritiformis]MDU5145168.1 hypothetical protein [Paenibacillus dendritiformis]NKI19938.1 hypothetical protein [Paenibacillus dendritiformis]NRG00269.1 hypothetical protein [Paenibacillus dendritiformis]